MHRILIIQTAFIGDVILATPLVEKLHRFFPDAHIDFLLRKGNESLLLDHPKIHKVWVWDKGKGKYKNLLSVSRQIRKNRYTLVVNLQRFPSTGFLTARSRASFRVGFDKNPFSFSYTHTVRHTIGDGKHEVDRNLALIAPFTDNTFQGPALYPRPQDFDAISAYREQKYRCIAPTSVWHTKQWPAEKWNELLTSLPFAEPVYLLGGKTDFMACEQLKNMPHNHPRVVNLAGKLGLLSAAALMKGAEMNYANDSAPVHLASAVDAPITAVFCSTVPAFGFGPLSARSHIAETDEQLACRPCGLHGRKTCPKGHFLCATSISVSSLPL
jgi:heptosyltransferase-2